jgi:hypothetical protein
MAKGKEKILTIREVAERTGASVNSIRVWLGNEELRQKRFPNAKKASSPIGDYWVIPESDIRGYKNQGRGRPQKPESELKRKRRTTS